MRANQAIRAGMLAFLTAATTLFIQVLVHRMVQARLLNNFAFFVISLTMLGFAFSGVVLTRYSRRFLTARDDVLLVAAASFGITLVAASVAFYRAPDAFSLFGPSVSFLGFLGLLLYSLPFSMLFAIPFVCSGLTLGLLLSDPALPTRRIYCWDLLGSSLGALAVIPAISHLGVESSALLAAGVTLAGAFVLTSPKSTLSRLLAGASALALIVAWNYSGRLFVMRYRADSILGTTQDPVSGSKLESIVWDPVARIEVTKIPPPEPGLSDWPCLFGTNRAFLSRFKRVLTQNNNAFTVAVDYDGRRESLQGIEETIYAAAYETTSVPSPESSSSASVEASTY